MWVTKAGDAGPTLIEDATLPYWQSRGYKEWGGAADPTDPDLLSATTAAVGAVVIIHGATAATPRPVTPTPVLWIGTVQPTALIDGDVYIPVTALS